MRGSWTDLSDEEIGRRQLERGVCFGRQGDTDDSRLAKDVGSRIAAEVVGALPGHRVDVSVEVVETGHRPPERELLRESRRPLEIEHRVDNPVLLRIRQLTRRDVTGLDYLSQ